MLSQKKLKIVWLPEMPMFVFAINLTSAAESRPLCFNFAGIMRGIDLDSDGSHGNGLENKNIIK